jgi:hypothetical protein
MVFAICISGGCDGGKVRRLEAKIADLQSEVQKLQRVEKP